MRGLAVLLVVAGHFTADRVPGGGVVGVTMFFALSGYLITGVLLQERERTGQVSYRNFYIRRFLRLFPAALLVLLVTPLIMWAVHDPRIGHYPAQGLISFFYLADYARAMGFDMGVLEHTWSLSVEEHFYLLWPTVLAALGVWAARRGSGQLPLAAGLAGAAVTWRVLAALLLPNAWTQYSLDGSAYALLLGCAAAIYAQERGELPGGRRVGWAAILALLGLSVAAVPFGGQRAGDLAQWIELVSALVSVALIGAAARGFWPMTNPLLRWFGTISYGWYLWHYVLLNVYPHGQVLTGGRRVLPLLASVGVAAASWYLYERPILRRKRRFESAAARPRQVVPEVA